MASAFLTDVRSGDASEGGRAVFSYADLLIFVCSITYFCIQILFESYPYLP